MSNYPAVVINIKKQSSHVNDEGQTVFSDRYNDLYLQVWTNKHATGVDRGYVSIRNLDQSDYADRNRDISRSVHVFPFMGLINRWSGCFMGEGPIHYVANGICFLGIGEYSSKDALDTFEKHAHIGLVESDAELYPKLLQDLKAILKQSKREQRQRRSNLKRKIKRNEAIAADKSNSLERRDIARHKKIWATLDLERMDKNEYWHRAGEAGSVARKFLDARLPRLIEIMNADMNAAIEQAQEMAEQNIPGVQIHIRPDTKQPVTSG